VAVADLLRRDEADALVRDAHLNVHRHPAGFPGFEARLRLSVEDAVSVGRVTVRPGSPPEITIVADADDRDWVAQELSSMATHRAHRAYEDGDGRFDKDLAGPEGPFGRLVHMADPMLSTYRIENGHITRIGRTIPPGRLSIVIQDQVAAPDGRSVATHFTVLVQDEESGAILTADVYRDAYAVHDAVLLPARRRVVSLSPGGSRTRELTLEHHRVLRADEVTA